jgi:hypothetical protein
MLDNLADDIERRPETLRPIPSGLIDRVRSLVGGVEVNLDQMLLPEINGAGTH